MLKKADRYLIQLALFIMLIASIVFLSSCKKSQHVKENCKCGEVLHKAQTTHQQTGHIIYGLRAINNCSLNDTLAEVSRSQYNAATVGADECFVKGW